MNGSSQGPELKHEYGIQIDPIKSSTLSPGGMGDIASSSGPVAQDQPDPDAIKMFVGQIPKSWDELKLRQLFENYGRIFQLNVLREKGMNTSKGCCFVTFYTRKSALEAQNDLHNIKTLPGMHHPVQVKPADSEGRNEERKLFVGMLSKKLSENDVRMMFTQFGEIEECRLLTNAEGGSKGCAFVTFLKRHMAQNAIRSMHHSTTMEGCSAPLVVKIADTPKDKERKKMQTQVQTQINALTSQWKNIANIAMLAPLLQGAQNTSNHFGNNPLQMPNLGQLSSAQLQQALTLAAAAQSILNNNQPSLGSISPTSPGLGNTASGSTGAPLSTLSSPHGGNNNIQINPGGNNYRSQNHSSSPMWNNSTHSSGSSSTNGFHSMGNHNNNPLGQMASSLGLNSSPQDGVMGQGGMNTGVSPGVSGANSNPYAQSLLQFPNGPAGSQKEGPEGANLFIYHLPSEFSDHDLMQTFIPFGNVVSSKVFIDKQTNLSKCFGFVSYDNSISAQNAIQAMNGFQIGMKRLKVQLKRSKNESKPY